MLTKRIHFRPGKANSWGGTPLALALPALLFVNASFAQVLLGEVVGISDGDTLTVLDADRRTHKIRLAGIDAPEKGQPFKQNSKESLSNLAYRQRVQIEWGKTDRYGRIVGISRMDSGRLNPS